VIPPEVIIVPAVFGIPATVLVVRMWFKHQEKMASIGRTTGDTASIEARLERVEQGIEAIAIEMERVGEGQRFLTNILAERPAALPEQAQAKLSGSPDRR
jgi:hypothetical protein